VFISQRIEGRFINDTIYLLPPPKPARKGGERVMAEYLIAFLISVVASVVAYYLCKWFDRDDDGDEPEA